MGIRVGHCSQLSLASNIDFSTFNLDMMAKGGKFHGKSISC